MESIHKSKAKRAREKTLADQFEAKCAKNKASRERKMARRDERLAQGSEEDEEVNEIMKMALAGQASYVNTGTTDGVKKHPSLAVASRLVLFFPFTFLMILM
ncbi:hypothetical protein V6N13_037774 [Hibiscus sabdariffa]|uniref:IBB domain-containing protein n=1 Tax=Hibiscus sabdariffa TaxID=183260 RepID=A0ABR2S4Q5_9ROSI